MCCSRVGEECRTSRRPPHADATVSCLVSRADKQLDLSTVDLRKLKVKELKKILEDWGESCKGCAEKSDFIRDRKSVV